MTEDAVQQAISRLNKSECGELINDARAARSLAWSELAEDIDRPPGVDRRGAYRQARTTGA